MNALSADAKFLEIVRAEGVPHPPSAVANYLPARRVGDLVYLSGQAPFRGKDIAYTGKCGSSVSLEDGKKAARLTGLNLLYSVRDAVTPLDVVACVVGIDGMVNSTPDFTKQSEVIDACSDLLVEIFGDAGKYTRSAVGQVLLAFDIIVEIKMQLLLRDGC